MTIRVLIRILPCLLVMLIFGVSAGSALADAPAPPAVPMTDDGSGNAPAADAPAPDPGAADTDVSAPPADAGAPPADVSAPPADAGAPPADAGAPPADAGAPPADVSAPRAEVSAPPADASTSPVVKSADDGEDPVKSPGASDDQGGTPAPAWVATSTTAPAQPAPVASAAEPIPAVPAAAPAPPPAAGRASAPRPSRVPTPTVLVASADGAVLAVASRDRASTQALVAALSSRARERSAPDCPVKRAPARRHQSYRPQLASVAQDSAPVREPGTAGTAGASSGGAAGAASPATRLLGVVTGPPAFTPCWAHRWPSLASWRSTFVTSVLERPD
jgi:hypothetical protein